MIQQRRQKAEIPHFDSSATEFYIRSFDGAKMIAVAPHNYVSEDYLLAAGLIR